MNDPYVPSSSQSSFHGGGPSSPSSTFPGTTAADYRFHPSQFRTLMNSHLASGAPGLTFTPQMRDRQARGKDPYTSGNGTDDGEMSDPDLRFGSGGQEQKKDFAQAERRRNAISYLDNPELLMIWAQSKGDSIAGARQHWMKVLCGFDDADPQGKNKQPPHFSQRYHHSSRHPGHHYHHAQPSRGAAGSSSSHQYYGQHH